MLDEQYQKENVDSNLKRRRKNLKLTQQELSEFSGVPLRTIQQYEQRQKDLNKASAQTLLVLSRSLYCNMEDLLEKV